MADKPFKNVNRKRRNEGKKPIDPEWYDQCEPGIHRPDGTVQVYHWIKGRLDIWASLADIPKLLEDYNVMVTRTNGILHIYVDNRMFQSR